MHFFWLDSRFVTCHREAFRHLDKKRSVPDPANAKLLVWNSSSALASPRISAAAIFEPKNFRGSAEAESRCLPAALFLKTPEASPEKAFAATFSRRPECVSEKWYRAEERFPEEAFRDAAEWLAAETH